MVVAFSSVGRSCRMDLKACTGSIIDSGYSVHVALGPGLLESAYHKCLAHELTLRGHQVRVKVPIPVHYKDLMVPVGYQADLIVDQAVIIEVKAVDRIHPIHEAQLLTYLKLTGVTVGLLLNFHETLFVTGSGGS